MTGAVLFDFLIAMVLLGLVAALFFAVISRVSEDPTFTQIAKIAVGGALLILFLLSIKGVLFGGGPALSLGPGGLIAFAVGAIVVLIVLYVVYFLLDRFGAAVGLADWAGVIRHVIAALALIALLVLAGNILTGGQLIGGAHFSLTR